LIKADMARQAVATLQDPRAKWMDFDECKLRIAVSKLAAARKAKKLTQSQLATKLGMPQSQLSRIERNPDQTTVRTLKRIAKALGIDIELLVG
jgi:ribosome-binding protein aMBF1 (putative translation factor)